MTISKNINDKSEIHSFFQDNLVKLFRTNGFYSRKEYKIEFIYRYRSRRFNGKLKLRNGLLDVFAQKGSQQVSIEFDSIRLIRKKNLEKLFQCNAKWCFAICLGVSSKYSVKETIRDNLKRIRQIYNEAKEYYKNDYNFIRSKHFWLGIMTNSYLKQINLGN